MICVSLGIVLLHTKIRDGASKGKVERHFRTLKERWLYGLDISSIHSIADFNKLLADYMRDYNTSYHQGIDSIPLQRFRNTNMHVRIPESRQWLEERFLNRITRKVRKDSTISVNNRTYDVPMQFISMKVDIRFLPNDMDSAFILYEGTQYPIRLTDKVANCHTKRQNITSIDYSKIEGGTSYAR